MQFWTGTPGGISFPLGSRGGGLEDLEGYACSTTVSHGKEPYSDSCIMTPVIPEGDEESELRFEVRVGSVSGNAELTIKYRWQPTPN